MSMVGRRPHLLMALAALGLGYVVNSTTDEDAGKPPTDDDDERRARAERQRQRAAERERVDQENRLHYARQQERARVEYEAKASVIRADRARRKAENFAQRQPKGIP